MVEKDDLVGVWVDHNVGGLGPVILVLHPDGLGTMDMYNAAFAGGEEFRWKLIEDGTKIEFSQYVDNPSRPATVEVISLHSRGQQRVLCIESDFPDDEALGIIGGHFVTNYYLSTTSICDYIHLQRKI